MKAAVGIVAAGLLSTGSLIGGPAIAQDVVCLPGSSPGATTVRGNLLVATPCELNGTQVNGNVQVFGGGSLVARGITVDGNLEARTAFEIELVESRIRGNLLFVELVGDESAILESRIDGNVLLERNRSFLALADNEIDSDVAARDNNGGLELIDNEIDGNLDCRGNNPPPTGRGNDVEGDVGGQCRNLRRPDDDEDEVPDGGGEDVPPFGGDSETAASPPESLPPPTPAPPAPAQPAFQSEPNGGGGGSADPLMLLAPLSLWLLLRRRLVRGNRGTEDFRFRQNRQC